MEGDYTDISNEAATTLVRKVDRRNGARLEIYSPSVDRRIYLDALLLESVAWQTPETFSELLEAPHEFSAADEEQIYTDDEYTEVSNEFASTLVRRVNIKNDTLLEIRSHKLDYHVYLDALLLESLTWQAPETLSRFLEEPYGPRGTHAGEEGLVDLG